MIEKTGNGSLACMYSWTWHSHAPVEEMSMTIYLCFSVRPLNLSLLTSSKPRPQLLTHSKVDAIEIFPYLLDKNHPSAWKMLHTVFHDHLVEKLFIYAIVNNRSLLLGL